MLMVHNFLITSQVTGQIQHATQTDLEAASDWFQVNGSLLSRGFQIGIIMMKT